MIASTLQITACVKAVGPVSAHTTETTKIAFDYCSPAMLLILNATLSDRLQVDEAQQSNRKEYGAKLPRLSHLQVPDDSSFETLRDCTATCTLGIDGII
ncbi:hypothetical protein BofuT4_uP051790.1 [Botrytis cinerea T4]|uniref:Uncharacterized protein n=1 Tax=Botryotinia fuckeliana (strain T4) TaxID=999810 RepID=G2XWG0_BOTF4|nr:hypothetical protein BofuT4_uP051790.1 [Botrytis cinerea T4]